MTRGAGIVDQPIDLIKLPARITLAKNKEKCLPSVTIPDLNGSALLLINRLVAYGVFELDQGNQEHEIIYKTLFTCYESHLACLNGLRNGALVKNINDFREALAKINVNKNIFMRLIGDELADRGKQDAFTLFVLNHLKQKDAPYEIIFSNHGAEFFRAYDEEGFWSGCPTLNNDQYQSVSNLSILLGQMRQGMELDKQELVQIVERAYKPNIKLLSYEKLPDGGINLFTHAPIDLRFIEWVAKDFNVIWSNDTRDSLCDTIDRINLKFADLIRKGEFCAKYSGQLRAYNSDQGVGIDSTSLVNFAWSRAKELNGSVKASDKKGLLETSVFQLPYEINFYYGHVGKNGLNKDNYHNLDIGQVGRPGSNEFTGQHYEFYGKTEVQETVLKHTKVDSIDPFELQLSKTRYSFLDLTVCEIRIINPELGFLNSAINYCIINPSQLVLLLCAGYKNFLTIDINGEGLKDALAKSQLDKIPISELELTNDFLKQLFEGRGDKEVEIKSQQFIELLKVGVRNFSNTSIVAENDAKLDDVIKQALTENKINISDVVLSDSCLNAVIDLKDNKIVNITAQQFIQLLKSGRKDFSNISIVSDGLKDALAKSQLDKILISELELTDDFLKQLFEGRGDKEVEIKSQQFIKLLVVGVRNFSNTSVVAEKDAKLRVEIKRVLTVNQINISDVVLSDSCLNAVIDLKDNEIVNITAQQFIQLLKSGRKDFSNITLQEGAQDFVIDESLDDLIKLKFRICQKLQESKLDTVHVRNQLLRYDSSEEIKDYLSGVNKPVPRFNPSLFSRKSESMKELEGVLSACIGLCDEISKAQKSNAPMR